MNRSSFVSTASAALVALLCLLLAPRTQPLPASLGVSFIHAEALIAGAPVFGTPVDVYRAAILPTSPMLPEAFADDAQWRRWQPAAVATPDIRGSDGALAFSVLSLCCGVLLWRRAPR